MMDLVYYWLGAFVFYGIIFVGAVYAGAYALESVKGIVRRAMIGAKCAGVVIFGWMIYIDVCQESRSSQRKT